MFELHIEVKAAQMQARVLTAIVKRRSSLYWKENIFPEESVMSFIERHQICIETNYNNSFYDKDPLLVSGGWTDFLGHVAVRYHAMKTTCGHHSTDLFCTVHKNITLWRFCTVFGAFFHFCKQTKLPIAFGF
jgi:hypothetical protein